MSSLALVVSICLAEVLGMLSFATFQALIPTFAAEWGLSNTDAGWISGIYFAGYVGAVPVLVSLTDRVDPKKIYLWSLALGGAASLAFALFAEGFWSALALRCLHGVGLAGTYMPGLKALSDRIEGPRQSRYVAFYTSSFGIGASLSYVMAGEISTAFDWHWTFAATAAGAVLAAALTSAVLPAAPPGTADHHTHLLDFRPVLQNRSAMAYILGYMGHNWELFAFRSWVVAFLVFAGGLKSGDIWLSATTIAAIATILGVPASILGNEVAVRVGRRRLIVCVTIASIGLSAIIGFSAAGYWMVVALCLLYGVLLTGDSAALTAGTVAAAAPGQRGATLAMHASLGFLGGVFGPLCVGVVLDAAGGGTIFGWGMAFLATGAGSAMALAAVILVASRQRE